MGTLAEQIEELRAAMVAASSGEISLVRGLSEEIRSHDAALAAELEALIEDHAARRQDHVRLIRLLASRIGYLPGMAPAVVPVDMRYRPGPIPPPLPPGIDVDAVEQLTRELERLAS